MRGSPPLHIFAFALAFAVFAVPLARLTFARPAMRQAAVATSVSKTTPTLLRLRLAHVPAKISVTLNGKELLPEASPKAAQQEVPIAVSIPPEGLELFVNAEWPPGTPDTAVTVELEPDGLETLSLTRWSSGPALSEPFSYYWKP